MHLINNAQFLNITPFFLLSARLAVALSPALVIVLVQLTSIYGSA